jgi:hypothetical protein
MPFNALCPTCSSTTDYKCNDDCIKIKTSEIKYVGPYLTCLDVDNCEVLTTIIQKVENAVCSINVELDTKVDKIPGKGLSANDFTDLLKFKLDGIQAGAEVNVNADWNATSGDALILNKPTTIAGYGITDAYTKTELNNGQLDNRYYTETEINNFLATKENTIAPGTTSQYWRGDKTWQNLNTGVVPESGNLYYTEARVDANANVSANTSLRHNPVTLGTANGLSLSTQVLSLGLASTSSTGALTSTDWNIFNNKENAFTKNTAFNKNFGTASGTVAEGNDSRILNGQTAFSWGNHALAGYLLATTAAITYVPLSRTLSINGTTYDLSANRSWTVGDIRSDSSYANPSWITQLAWGKLTGVPTASTTTSGILTSTDYTTLINKVSSQWISNGNDIHYTAGKVLIGTSISGNSKLKIVGLPTSPAGLSIGDVWINGCTLEIVTGNDCTTTTSSTTLAPSPSSCGSYTLCNETTSGSIATFTYNEYPTNAFITVDIPFGSECVYIQAFVGTVNSSFGSISGPTPCI